MHACIAKSFVQKNRYHSLSIIISHKDLYLNSPYYFPRMIIAKSYLNDN